MAIKRRRDNLGKVVVRTRDGSVLCGFSSEGHIKEDEVTYISREGKEQSCSLDDLKAVFFVRDFKGDSDYREVKFFKKQDESKWLWVRITFFDEELIEGRVQNDKELLFSNGFYLWPSDEETNNELVYIVKSAVKDFIVLGIH